MVVIDEAGDLRFKEIDQVVDRRVAEIEGFGKYSTGWLGWWVGWTRSSNRHNMALELGLRWSSLLENVSPAN